MAQSVGPEFKPQYHRKQTKAKQTNEKVSKLIHNICGACYKKCKSALQGLSRPPIAASTVLGLLDSKPVESDTQWLHTRECPGRVLWSGSDASQVSELSPAS
jgi:hypothetical protein